MQHRRHPLLHRRNQNSSPQRKPKKSTKLWTKYYRPHPLAHTAETPEVIFLELPENEIQRAGQSKWENPITRTTARSTQVHMDTPLKLKRNSARSKLKRAQREATQIPRSQFNVNQPQARLYTHIPQYPRVPKELNRCPHSRVTFRTQSRKNLISSTKRCKQHFVSLPGGMWKSIWTCNKELTILLINTVIHMC